MGKILKRFASYVLTLAMIITLLPPQTYAASEVMDEASGTENHNDLTLSDTESQGAASMSGAVSTNDEVPLEDAKIVRELIDRRTEYSKEYKLDNGLNLAVVYSEPVHYKENGNWKEIDNTLKAHGSGESVSYKNTAGSWQVEFPQQLDDSSSVKVSKDGYEVSFLMSGELRFDTAMKELRAGVENAKVSKTKKSHGKIHTYDYSKQKEQAQHPEVIQDKLRSRMSYSDVYNNTDVIYDLDPYQLKESIVISKYDSSVYGYVYTLDTGKLVPVLNEDGSVELKTSKNGEVVMTMPAPFMIDNEGTICTEVSVTLEKAKKGYQLTYFLWNGWQMRTARGQWYWTL